MSDLGNFNYYQRREEQERALADAAEDPIVRDIHLEMAEKYAAFLRREEVSTRQVGARGS